MTAAQLIALLHKADPSGAAEVAIYDPTDDYFFGIIDISVDARGNVHLEIGDLHDAVPSAEDRA